MSSSDGSKQMTSSIGVLRPTIKCKPATWPKQRVPEPQCCGNIGHVRQSIAAENEVEATSRIIQGFGVRLYEVDVANTCGHDGLRGLIQHASRDIHADYPTPLPD